MYKNKKILAVVMARGGSKGIKYKNLKKINNRSLVSISAKLLKKIKNEEWIIAGAIRYVTAWKI